MRRRGSPRAQGERTDEGLLPPLGAPPIKAERLVKQHRRGT